MRGCESVALPGDMKFNCPKCRWGYSLGIGITRGTQTWCLGCNTGYVQTSTRWRRNNNLKAWWSSMKPDMQCAWFRKWLTLGAKKRFEMFTFAEGTINAKEEMEDDIDRHIP